MILSALKPRGPDLSAGKRHSVFEIEDASLGSARIA